MSDFAQQLLDLARQRGAEFAEVYQGSSVSHPVTFEANRLKQLETSESIGTALRLWYQGRPGLAVAYGHGSPQLLVEKAIALSQLQEPTPLEVCEPRRDINPPIGTAMDVETLVEKGKAAIAQLRDHYPEILCSGVFDCESSHTLLVNSEGLYCTAADISLSYGLEVEWVRGDDFLGIYDGDITQDSLDPEATVQRLLERLHWAKQNSPATTGKVPVIFTSNAAPLLWSTVAAALNGKNILEKSSPWSQALGQRVISPQISLYQDPTAKPYICHFDDEGTPTRSLSLVREGFAQDIYGDRQTSRNLGIRPTGNGFRASLGRYPTPELANLIVAPGVGTLNTIISQLDTAIVVDQILGGDADLSGDFSVNIDLGYQVRQGQITGRIKDTLVTGNVYEALKQVIEVGGDRRWQGSCYTPCIALESLSIVA
ncbi:peptidase C69 [Picosynechococcus sp. PCC 7003]|uniref:TldD/PmbA family protein n=1 Tax=Picosynechococcus sp. PCC 7003 TaxID=374981 RepID=UPI000810802D|nr:TldD/PmbA family protein [Picosynechococcus sp. PCC 7003]ANV84088.1 peptidase C69 [Picosynechococcus sp. PCC 7003]